MKMMMNNDGDDEKNDDYDDDEEDEGDDDDDEDEDEDDDDDAQPYFLRCIAHGFVHHPILLGGQPMASFTIKKRNYLYPSQCCLNGIIMG